MKVVVLTVALHEAREVHVVFRFKLVKSAALRFNDFVNAGQAELKLDALTPLSSTRYCQRHAQLDS